MSDPMLPLPTKAKKRKHAAADDAEHTPKKSKKDSSKSKDKREKKKNRDKVKAVAPSPATLEDSEFVVVRSSLRVSIPPVFAGNPRAGVEEMLDSMLMRYVPALDGVVLAHANLAFCTPTARIVNDCPFAVCDVEFDATVWSPRVGMKLTARINLSSPDHIALLVHRTFNVSIPRHHIPTDSWEFEYGPAENDPEYGAEAGAHAEYEAGVEGGEAGEEKVAEAGRWIHSTTGGRLGGKDGILEFTVVGLTVANQMLSLIGSIQPDPFSPAHVPQTVPASSQPRLSPSTPPPMNAWDEEEEGDEDEEGEGLDVDGRPLEEVADEEEERLERERLKEREEAAKKVAKKEKKRKRPEEAQGGKKKRTS